MSSQHFTVEDDAAKAKKVRKGLVEVDIDDDNEIVEVKKQKASPKVTRWCITWNNPNIEESELATKLQSNSSIKGGIFQLEVGDSGTEHYQMYLEFTGAVRETGVRKALGTTAVSTFCAKGSKEDNIKYCSKVKGRIGECFRWGTCSKEFKSEQGKRNDLDRFAVAVRKAGKITEEIKEEFPGHLLHFRKHVKDMLEEEARAKAEAEELAFWQEQIRREDAGEETQGQQQRELILLFGPTAVGKTTYAMKDSIRYNNQLPYKKSGSTKWWDGYKGQDCVIIDEWRNKFGSIEDINEMSNKGTLQIEFKGGCTVLSADRMYFTTNRHPLHIFGTEWKDPRYRALVRRFKQVHWWNDNKVLKVLKNPGEEPVYMGDEPSEDWQDWNKSNIAWVHFWRQLDRPIQEGDTYITGEDNYFTW